MVKIKGIQGFRPVDPESFTMKPYDVVEKDEELDLKKNPKSAVHAILPDGEGDEVYKNAEKELNRLIEEKIIIQDNEPSIFIYRQDSNTFSQEGFIFKVSLKDYEEGLVKKHEHTREKPLKDRTAHITATKMNTGLVWTVFKHNNAILDLMEKIKNSRPEVDFEKYGYRNRLWKASDKQLIKEIKNSFQDIPLYIADGHHRVASAAAFRNKMLEEKGSSLTGDENWNYFMTYVASDHQVRILPYNRVIKSLKMEKGDFISKISENFTVDLKTGDFVPTEKHEIGMFLDDTWYRLRPKQTDFGSTERNLDVSILQELLIDPILGITDIRNDPNIFFVGDAENPKEMARYVTEKGNAIFFSLYPVHILDIEDIADKKGVMPPKSTWFDPKLLTGLIFNPLF